MPVQPHIANLGAEPAEDAEDNAIHLVKKQVG
jgi:hypothetical protein